MDCIHPLLQLTLRIVTVGLLLHTNIAFDLVWVRSFTVRRFSLHSVRKVAHGKSWEIWIGMFVYRYIPVCTSSRPASIVEILSDCWKVRSHPNLSLRHC